MTWCIAFEEELHISFSEVKNLASIYSAQFENPMYIHVLYNCVTFTSVGVSSCVMS